VFKPTAAIESETPPLLANGGCLVGANPINSAASAVLLKSILAINSIEKSSVPNARSELAETSTVVFCNQFPLSK
jgi:hypothetical protein